MRTLRFPPTPTVPRPSARSSTFLDEELLKHFDRPSQGDQPREIKLTAVAEKMERPTGPLGVATQSTGRAMFEYGAFNRAASNTTHKSPNTTIRPVASNSSLSTQVPISAAQVIALAQEAMRNALEENQTKAAEASGVSNELKPGVTIDLSHKNIQNFPDEVVDIIKSELERYDQSPDCIVSVINNDHLQTCALPQLNYHIPS